MAETKKYLGLWYQGHGIYKSQIITTASIESLQKLERTRLYVAFNKCYGKNENGNRPKFVFWFSDFEIPKGGAEFDVENFDVENEEVETVKAIEVETAKEIAIDMIYDAKYGYSADDLVVDAAGFMASNSFEALKI